MKSWRNLLNLTNLYQAPNGRPQPLWRPPIYYDKIIFYIAGFVIIGRRHVHLATLRKKPADMSYLFSLPLIFKSPWIYSSLIPPIFPRIWGKYTPFLQNGRWSSLVIHADLAKLSVLERMSFFGPFCLCSLFLLNVCPRCFPVRMFWDPWSPN